MHTAASYPDYRRAIGAIERLIEQGHNREDLSIAAHLFEERPVRPPDTFSKRLTRVLAITGPTTIALFVGLLVTPSVDVAGAGAAFGIMLVIAVAAGVIGAVVAGYGGHGRFGRHRVVASAYDVIVPDNDEDAGHELAQWWDTELEPPERTPDGHRVLTRSHQPG